MTYVRVCMCACVRVCIALHQTNNLIAFKYTLSVFTARQHVPVSVIKNIFLLFPQKGFINKIIILLYSYQ